MEFSKSTSNMQKKIDVKIGESFKEYKARLLQEQEAIESKERSAMVEQADLINAKRNRQRNKLNEAQKRLAYEETSTIIGLTEALTDVVKSSLLLDIDEYAKINENYEEFIKENIKSFLENAEINLNTENKNTIKLLESINKAKPSVEVGIYLTEQELLEEFNKAKVIEFDNDARDEFGRPSYNDTVEAIDSLSCNVMDRVAEIIDNDRTAAQKVDDQLNAMVTPLGESKTLLVRNQRPTKTVLEVLAINEANEMISSGKEYNSDLALANAITYITVLEALDVSGLVKVGKSGYDAILEAAGEKQEKRVAKNSHAINLIEKKAEEEIQEKVSLVENQVSSARHAGFTSFSEWKKQQNVVVLDESKEVSTEVKYDYVDKNGNKVLTEDVKREAIRKGFDLEVNNFQTICRILGYRKL